MSFQTWLSRRESGLNGQFELNSLYKRLYKTIAPFTENDVEDIGGVFNLEFSPEGNILVGACEKKSILFFDAITTKEYHKIGDAHTENVNCIKFLDNHTFASCSDDTTVAIWDLRHMKTKVRSLHGHSNWVKNIEYSHKNNLLVTSGFDGSIFTWDINSHTEQGLIYQKVFHTSGLMRCRITPDGDKLIICTTGGYIMIIHNLDLTTLHKDLCGFRPSIYRLMQMGQQYIPQAAKFDHVFSKQQKKNRVELVTDFPVENDAEVIMALQIHPQGHCFLSRNISCDESTEWSCVHDLNEEPGDITEKPKRKRKMLRDSDDDSTEETETSNNRDAVVFTINRRVFDRARFGNRGELPPLPPPAASSTPAGGTSQAASNNQQTSPQRRQWISHRQENFVPDIWAAEVTVQERAIRQNRMRGSNSTAGYNFVYAISSGVLPVVVTSTTRSQGTMTPTTRRYVARSTTPRQQASTERQPADSNSSTSSNSSPPHLPPFERIRMRSLKPFYSHNSRQIFQNPKKLLYYIQESNNGKGFIKEPCFSRDGRIICSPYDKGVRLLGFTEDCSEFPHQLMQSDRRSGPTELLDIQNIAAHSDIVLSTKFSPREPLLVTGCRSGKVVWYHPNF